MKKFILFLTVFTMLFSMSFNVFADESISESANSMIFQINNPRAILTYDTKDAKDVFLETPPMIINGRTMVPAKFIAESLGGLAYWDKDSQKVIILRKGYWLIKGMNPDNPSQLTYIKTKKEDPAPSEIFKIELKLNDKIACVSEYRSDEEKAVELEQASVSINGRTLVPLRFIAEMLDLVVYWDEARQVIVIATPEKAISLESPEEIKNYVETMPVIPTPTPTPIPTPTLKPTSANVILDGKATSDLVANTDWLVKNLGFQRVTSYSSMYNPENENIHWAVISVYKDMAVEGGTILIYKGWKGTETRPRFKNVPEISKKLFKFYFPTQWEKIP